MHSTRDLEVRQLCYDDGGYQDLAYNTQGFTQDYYHSDAVQIHALPLIPGIV